MPRKTTTAAATETTPEVDAQKFTEAHSAMIELAQDEDATAFEIGQQVGAIMATRMWGRTFRAAELQMFERLRALPPETIKKVPINVDGTLRRAERVPEFCELVFGVSYSKLAEESQNLETLGEEVYGLATRLGLNRNALRAARALPPEKLETVRQAIANGTSKAEVLSVIEDLAVKVQTAEKEAADAKAEQAAAEELVAKKNQAIDKLTKQVRRIERLPADEALAEMKKEAAAATADAEGAVLGSLRQALVALSNHGESGAHAIFMAGLVGQVQARLNEIRQEFNLPDVSAAQLQQLADEVKQWASAS